MGGLKDHFALKINQNDALFDAREKLCGARPKQTTGFAVQGHRKPIPVAFRDPSTVWA